MSKTVSDVIRDREQVYCISNEMTVAEAARYLRDRGIRATGVCNLSGKIVGVISQSDISDKVVAENCMPAEVMALSVASQNLIKIPPEAECRAAMQLMRDKSVYHLIVEDAEGNFLGMISMRDCVSMSAEDDKERAEIYKSYAFPNY